MCGILGVVMKKYDSKILNLIKELNIRGTHAYGIAFSYDGFITTRKFHELKDVLIYITGTEIKRFIFHNRYSTSGDYNDDNNNQPLIYIQEAMVFNGVISMATKLENEKRFKMKLMTDNDGEIILRAFCPIAFLRNNPDASFAGLFLNNSSCYGVRNNKRPLYLYEDENFKILVSTIDTLARSGFDLRKAQRVKPFELVVLK